MELRNIKDETPVSILRAQGKLVLELCQFTEALNPSWSSQAHFQRLRALSEPIKKEVATLKDQKVAFQKICHYFFDELGFQVSSDSNMQLKDYLLPCILESRQGPPQIMMLLFSCLLEESYLKSQIACCRNRFLLKVQLGGRAHIADIFNKGQLIDHQEILELVNEGFDFSSGPLNNEILLIEYLSHVKKRARQESKLHILSTVHSYLMRYQPFNLKHLSERAIVAFETGDYKTALDDIRSYFHYKQPERTNIRLKQIYRQAIKRQRFLNLKSKEREL